MPVASRRASYHLRGGTIMARAVRFSFGIVIGFFLIVVSILAALAVDLIATSRGAGPALPGVVTATKGETYKLKKGQLVSMRKDATLDVATAIAQRDRAKLDRLIRKGDCGGLKEGQSFVVSEIHDAPPVRYARAIMPGPDGDMVAVYVYLSSFRTDTLERVRDP